MRISDGFSFLVSMLIGVFKDLKFFFIFYLLILIMFSIMFFCLALTLDENLSLLSGFGYLIMAYRTSLGDFMLDDYKDQMATSTVTVSWVIWAVAVFILNIIFMNFIIAVISESYEKVMMKLV